MGRGALLLVSGFLIIFGMVQNSVQNRQRVLAERSPAYYYEEQSRNIAASMMEVALSKFNNNFYWTGPYNNDDFMGGSGSITVDSTAAFGSRVYLTITGSIGLAGEQTTTTIKAVANRPAFSIYSYFTIEEPVIYFTDGDVLNGPVHTNGTFHIQGDPVFNGKVTSPHTPIKDYGSHPEYNKGHDFDADPIDLPKNLAKLSNEAVDGGLHFDDDKVKVVFKEDGTADITSYIQTGTEKKCVEYSWWGGCARQQRVPTYSEGTTQTHDLSEPGFNGIISSTNLVEVKGIVKGNITLHSEQDIKIIGDVQYDDFNPNNPDKKLSSNNLLGIVSEGNVVVDKDAHKDHGSSDLNITASIMAMGESFEVEGYDDGDDRGYLNILGGLIQKKRGPVGLVNGAGYSKSYTYDKRLLTNSTPDFPKVKRFEIESLKETTHKASSK